MEELRAQLEALSRDNAILKRAVVLQNAKLQEVAHKEDELRNLRSLVQECQKKIHNLELTNYSLSMHLRHATGPTTHVHGGHNPDVY